MDSWKPNLPSQHGAFKENINFCEVSHRIMRAGNGKEQMRTCQRLWPLRGAIIESLFVGLSQGQHPPPPTFCSRGEKSLWQRAGGAGGGGKCPSVPFQLFSLPAVLHRAGRCFQLFPCPAKRGWEGKTGMNKGWIGDPGQYKTLKYNI